MRDKHTHTFGPVHFFLNARYGIARLIGSLRCYDDYGQNKIIQINGSKENLSLINNRVYNTIQKVMKI